MISQGAQICKSNTQDRRPPIAVMYTFSDEVLFKIFCHFRPVLSLADENEPGCDHNLEGGKWENERWWYKLVHVCRRWRHLVFASASYLRLSLLCTYGTPIAEILTYPPALPLIIDYGDKDREVAAQDEEGILLALRRHRRVRRIRLWMPAPSLRRLLVTMDGEFPMLEDLNVKPLTNDDKNLSLPDTFNAPYLRHFVLRNVTYTPVVLHRPLPTHHVPSAERDCQSTLYYGPQLWRSLRMFVHILDDDSLLNIFNYCRPVMVDGGTPMARMLQGGEWDRERWWYKFTHVCRRWRRLILVSASHLNLCLVCAPGTPVADMLTNSPPFPLIIDHIHYEGSINAEDEEGIMLALQHRNRVRRIRLLMPILDLQKLLPAVDEEFPMLEYLYMVPLTKSSLWSILPNTFQAPHLHHLILRDFAFPLRSPFFMTGMTGMGLTTFSLQGIFQSAYSHPNDLLQQISLMPQLETLRIIFCSTIPNRDLERQLMRRPVTTHVTLPNLRWLGLRATSTYIETLLPRMTTPLLERLEIRFFFQLNFPVSRLMEFMVAADNLRFGSANLTFFNEAIFACVYPHVGAKVESFFTDIACAHIDWQVSFAAQIFRSLNTVSSGVEHLTLEIFDSLETNNDVDRTQWRELLRSFSNVKVLRINRDFLEHISRSLRVDEGESPLELLPELKELQYPQIFRGPNPFGAFIDARQNAGRPVTFVRH